MKATRIHYFFAEDWPIRIWMTTSVFLFVAGSAWKFWPCLVFPSSWMDPLLFFGCMLLGALLGWFCGILFGWPVIGPLYYARSLMNGERFHEGDIVQILIGPHRDRIVRVIKAYDFASYAGAHRIRVDLGDQVEDGANVFSSTQVLRIEASSSRGLA